MASQDANTERSARDEQLIEARALLASLNVGWHEIKQQLRPGAQAAVLVVENKNGERGVFRCLPNNADDVAIARFRRELKILTDVRFEHPNIMKILGYPKDAIGHWYISKLGHQFKSRWDRFVDHTADPVAVVYEAVRIIEALADGLSRLHRAGVVHRDLKPGNIISMNSELPIEPVLIDFGIAHAEDGIRLTPLDGAVGNKQFSPDVMMRRMEQPTPWLDIFELSQLLIWMTQAGTARPHYDRPLDSRYVNYDARLPEEIVLALRSVTAVCSEQRLAPADSECLVALLRERFPRQPKPQAADEELKISNIERGIAAGAAQRDIARTEDERMLGAALAAAAPVYTAIRASIDRLTEELRQHNVPFRVRRESNFDKVAASLTAAQNEGTLFEYEFGRDHHFQVEVRCCAFPPGMLKKLNPEQWQWISSANPVAFHLSRPGVMLDATAHFKGEFRWVSVERDGKLMLRDQGGSVIEAVTPDRIGALLKSWVEDEALWAFLERGG